MSSSELSPEIAFQQFLDAIRKPTRQTTAPPEVLEWLVLLPSLPEKVVERGVPDFGMMSGEVAKATLQQLAEDGWIDSGNASPPWSGKCYWMTQTQRRRALKVARNRPRNLSGSLLDEANRACRYLTSLQQELQTPYSPSLRHWCALLQPITDGRPPDQNEIADRLVYAVEDAVRKARSLGLNGSPEAASLLDAAEPLVTALGGPLGVAAARCQRELELHHRHTRDEALLRNYQQRTDLDGSFEQLLASRTQWAIHYIGDGGVGKTMFLRHLQSTLADKFKLATARVDFDHLNPDYPLRSPGLLLLSFAEELKLEAPEAAIDYFRNLARAVNEVHANLEAARREGRDVPLGFSAPGFDFCLTVFVEALSVIERSGRRPVLILDTCEELVRLRFDGKLPRTVIETFLILEDLQRRIPELRIVLSGRRPLAGNGMSTMPEDANLPPRDYLVVHQILGFNRDQALNLLRGYRRIENDPQRGISADLHEGILDLSKSSDDTTEIRYNPFDVDLYAGWAATGGLTRDNLHTAGRHHYVRERIVARLRDDVRTWIPHLTILGRVDEALVAEFVGNFDDPARLWPEIRQQEWVDMDRGAVEQTNDLPVAFWNVDQQVRKKLRAYYMDEMTIAWSDACRQLAGVLERITIDRDWRLLTPSYFQVAAELMQSDPKRAAQWWTKVEEKILNTDNWDWANRITAALLDNGRESESHALSAPIRALRANVQMRASAEDESLEGLWSAVGRLADSYPDANGRLVLQYRAREGIVAHVRYRSDTLNEHYVHEFQRILEGTPSLSDTLSQLSSADTESLRRQVLYSEIGLLDNAVEVMEQVVWSSPPRSGVIDVIVARAQELGKQISAEAWVGIYIQRMRVLAGTPDEQWSWLSAWESPQPEILHTPAFDYVPSEHPDTRKLLECGRILERGGIRRFINGFAEQAIRSTGRPENLDQDRLLSQAWRFMPEVPRELAAELVLSSIRVASQRETCQAHKTVPPLYVTVIQLMSAAGDIDPAINLLQQARSTQPGEQVVRWLDRVAAHVNKRYLLAEPGTEDPQLPDLPFSRDVPNPVTLFMTATMVNLIKAAENSKGPSDELERETQLAEAICERQGFKVPTTTADLQNVSLCWRPWFARYLIVRLSGDGRMDAAERQALRDFLKSLYGTDLPPDVAFLDPKTAAQATPPPQSRARFPIVTVFAAILGFGFIFVLIPWLIDRGAERFLNIDLSWWQALLVWFFFSGIFSGAPVLLRLYARIAGTLTTFTSNIFSSKDGTHAIHGQMRTEPVGWVLPVPTPKIPEGPLQFDDMAAYETAANRFRDTNGKSIRIRMSRWLLSHARMKHVLLATEPAAKVCWEAFLGMCCGSSPIFSDSPFLYRRMSEKRWIMEEPFMGKMAMISVSALRDLGDWTSAISDTSKFEAFNLNYLPEDSNRQAGVLILQAEASIINGALRFATQPKSKHSFGADDLARLFPNLRLLVLLSPDRGEVTARTPTDRLFASQMRAAAHELYRVAAPAVLCIPGLPSRTILIDETLKVIANIVHKRPGDAVPPLQKAVRKIQDLIFEKSGLAAADATELAYDVCFYATDHINMKVDVTRDNYQRKGRNVRA
jgi:hypothetical protein